ncbi:trypsin-like peptidase domain-containing protein [Candidatus Pacearchaeota archaeon]|nr:trypsin-like peptidase domain-containing protein [Candidatus Pacearchaeota archaeon]
MDNRINLDTYAGQVFFSVVRIESKKNGESEPATGFIVSEKINEKSHMPLIITNKHVIEEADEVIFSFVKSDKQKPILGEEIKFKLTNPKSFFLNHPDSDVDLTALPLAPILKKLEEVNQIPFYIPIPNTPLIATRDDLSNFDTIEDIIFVGYPNGIYDKTNLTPVVRKGITATPISLPFNGKSIFLIDSMIFIGSSGSPVFVYNKGIFSDGKGNTSLGSSRLVFVGVVSEFHVSNQYLSEKDMAISTLLNLGEVIGSDKVKELISFVLTKGGNARD